MKNFRRLLPLAVVVIMLMGLLVPAAPVQANVSAIKVSLFNSTPGATTRYHLVFNTTAGTGDLAAGTGTITIVFPDGTDITGVAASNVVIMSMPCLTITKSGTTLTATVPVNVPGGNDRNVVVNNVVNPGAGTGYTLTVQTSQEPTPVPSEIYDLPGVVTVSVIGVTNNYIKSTNSTYSFTIQLQNFVPSDGTIIVTFGHMGGALQNVTAADCTLTHGTWTTPKVTATVNAIQNKVVFTVNPGAWVQQNLLPLVTINNVTNSNTTGTYWLTVNTSINDSGTQSYGIPVVKNIYVKKTGLDANDGLTWATARLTIGAALAIATAGDQICVGYGTYQENITVNTAAVTISGNYPAGGGAAYDPKLLAPATVQPVSAAGIVFSVTAPLVTIQYFTITGASDTGSKGIQFIGSTGRGGQVRDCAISGNYIGVLAGNGGGGMRILGCDITNNTQAGVYVAANAAGGNQVQYCSLTGNGTGVSNSSASNDVNANMNWWGHASGPDGPRLDSNGNPTGILPGKGNPVTAGVWVMPWYTQTREKVLADAIAYFAIVTYANKGWNIISTPIALDGYTREDNTSPTSGKTTNTWAGIWDFGKRESGDDYALKLHYTVVGAVKVYTPMYSFNSANQTWVQATGDTEVKPIDAYYVRMMDFDTVPILFSPDKSSPSKYLYQGWNLVGYNYMPLGGPGKTGISSSIETALKTVERVSSAAGDVKGYAQVVSPPMNQYPWIYVPPAGGGAGGTFIAPEFAGEHGKEAESCVMVVGRGYWVFMTNPGILAGLTFTPMSFRMQY